MFHRPVSSDVQCCCEPPCAKPLEKLKRVPLGLTQTKGAKKINVTRIEWIELQLLTVCCQKEISFPLASGPGHDCFNSASCS